jgi:hypothetical protein
MLFGKPEYEKISPGDSSGDMTPPTSRFIFPPSFFTIGIMLKNFFGVVSKFPYKNPGNAAVYLKQFMIDFCLVSKHPTQWRISSGTQISSCSNKEPFLSSMILC